MKYKKIIIYGGSSEISLELINVYADKCEGFIIFCRSKEKFIKLIKEKYINKDLVNNTEIFETDLIDLDKNLEIIKTLKQKISGLIWIAGYTGNAEHEYENINEAERNIKINLLNPILIITELSKVLIKKSNSFIAVFTSVAGLRGRKKQLYYSSSKSGLISFLSALRQKLFKDQILVTTVIPGYMNTKPFRKGDWNAPRFLISNPNIVALKLKKSIDNNNEIIYINYFWKMMMIIVKLIPEKIFKKFSF